MKFFSKNIDIETQILTFETNITIFPITHYKEYCDLYYV